MNDLAIRACNLSKKYKIVVGRPQHDTLRDQVTDALKSVFRRNGHADASTQIVWALKDLSLEVRRGEVMGIIGHNGAGKSTLLKILSRITEPTAGRAEIFGRVGSLLEVGTGFDRELTGRENTYLNGAILGMKKAELDRKFDEIVEFSEVGKFIDTPVKYYSSGMYVRLAFAVAAHLEPDILIVDEVLAVGDAGFQKKCLGKMGEVAQHGRTVLLVSHNMAAIEGLCNCACWLEAGKVRMIGASRDVVVQYALAHVDAGSGLSLNGRRGNQRARIDSARIRGQEAGDGAVFMGESFQLHLRIAAGGPVRDVNIATEIFSSTGIKVMSASTYRQNMEVRLPAGETEWVCEFQTMPLRPGIYRCQLVLATDWDEIDILPEALCLEVLPRDVLGSGRLLDETGGIAFARFRWRQAIPLGDPPADAASTERLQSVAIECAPTKPDDLPM